MIKFVAVSLLVIAVFSLPLEDEVQQLPGWEAKLPSRMFSGYVSAGSDEKYDIFQHYIFIESESDPANDPVVMFTNGGPGAASLFGLFVELGPLMFSGASMKTEYFNKTGVPSLFYNEFGWTKIANLLIINAPAPVGFSYCDPVGPSGNGTSCGDWEDYRVATHNAIFIENFAKKFPEYARHDWFLTGESYAGVYVPMLTRALLERGSEISKQIKGFAVGDACVGNNVLCGSGGPGPYFGIEFLQGHGQFSRSLYTEIMNVCPRAQLIGPGPVSDEKCNQLLNRMHTEVGGYYAYSLYDVCWYQYPDVLNKINSQTRGYWGPPRPQDIFNPNSINDQGAVNDYPCGGPNALFLWVNQTVVRLALHVSPDAFFFSGDNGVGFNYTLTEQNLLPFYHEVVSNTPLRVLVYNGDTDPGINSFLAQNWTSYLGFPETESWRPWTLDGKKAVAGYVTRYENDFDFLTIRGSGHMVPEYKPQATLEFLRRWLKNENWQYYVPS